MPSSQTTTDHVRHLIALHLGAETRYISENTAQTALYRVLKAAQTTARLWDETKLSDGAALRLVDVRLSGGLRPFVTRVLDLPTY